MNRKTRMKRKSLLGTLLLCLVMMMVTACGEDKIPAKANAFISQTFPESNIVLVEMDRDDEGMEYCVWLNDGTKVEFDLQGNWKRVGRNKTGVPTKLIPPAILHYLKKNYPQEVVTKLSKKPYGYKTELSNDMDLRFNARGQFLEVID